MDANWHNEITAQLGGKENYGKGILPNPFIGEQREIRRRRESAALLEMVESKIASIFEPRFITGIETCELMSQLITMIGAKQILELGTCTGFGSLHFLRAIVGKSDAMVTSIDCRPALDREWFSQPEIAKWFRFVEGWTPDVIPKDRSYDFVFVDSDHSVEHTQKEIAGLMPVTHPGTMFCFHDVPEWRTPNIRETPPVRTYLLELIKRGDFQGFMLPSPEQMDCLAEYGPNYPEKCNPGLAVLIRQ